jgi:hypothetical protein
MKKSQDAVRYGGPFGEALTASQRRAMGFQSGRNRSLPVTSVVAKHQYHKVPFLRIGGASCGAR